MHKEERYLRGNESAFSCIHLTNIVAAIAWNAMDFPTFAHSIFQFGVTCVRELSETLTGSG